MLTRPGSLSGDDISAAVSDGWSVAVERVRYAPVGFGSHHWTATGPDGERLFVTVDDLAAKIRPSDGGFDESYTRLWHAMRTARDLADAGHSFVVAPLPGREGDIVHRLDERFTIACFPYLEGRAGTFDDFGSGTALVAPRERDLWHLAEDKHTVVNLYRRAGGPEVNRERLDRYRMHWDLDEISGYIALLRAEHDDTDDALQSFQNLTRYLESAHRWRP